MQGTSWILEGIDQQINHTFDLWMLRACVTVFLLTCIGILGGPDPNMRLADSSS